MIHFNDYIIFFEKTIRIPDKDAADTGIFWVVFGA